MIITTYQSSSLTVFIMRNMYIFLSDSMGICLIYWNNNNDYVIIVIIIIIIITTCHILL